MARNRRILVVAGLVLVLGVIAYTALEVLPGLLDDDPGGSGAAIGTGEPLNVLIIVADDLGSDKLSTYADDADPDYRATSTALPLTPGIDALAAAGVRFTDAWANPNCSPTRASLLTGNHPFRHGVSTAIGMGNARTLPPTSTTLAEVAKGAGYATGLFGKWHLGETSEPAEWDDEQTWATAVGSTYAVDLDPRLHGFETFHGTLGGALDEDGHTYMEWVEVSNHDEGGVTACSTLREEYATQVVADRFVEWANAQTKTWLAVVAFQAPHSPWEAPPAGCHRHEDPEWAPTGELETYQAMVECMDLTLEEMLARVTDLDDTFIIFVGDNGTEDAVAEGRFKDGRGKGTVYESGVRVPLVAADGRTWKQGRPGFRPGGDWRDSLRFVFDPGAESAEPVSVVDIFATAAEVIGTVSSANDAISFVPVLAESDGPLREVNYTETFTTSNTGSAAVRKGNFKLVVAVDKVGASPCRSRYELYDLIADRFETTNLKDSDPNTFADLKAEVDAYARLGRYKWLDVAECA